MQRLVTMLQEAEEYVGTVVDGKVSADPHMGRKVRIVTLGISSKRIVTVAAKRFFLVEIDTRHIFIRLQDGFHQSGSTPSCSCYFNTVGTLIIDFNSVVTEKEKEAH